MVFDQILPVVFTQTRQLPGAGRDPKGHVLHDDHRPVDDDAEVDGAQAHQVGVDAKDVHQREGEQQAQRNDRGHHQTRADVSQQQHHHEDNDQAPQDQVFGDRMGGLSHQFATLQKGVDVDSFGQICLNSGHPGLHVRQHLLGVASLEHHHLPQHLLALAVARDRSEAGGVAVVHLGHVPHQHGDVARLGHHHVLNVADRPRQPFAPDEVRLVALLDVGSSGHAVVFLQCIIHLQHRHV